ncbi:MAG: hypothetical protein HYY93_03100 [Planctomycetes bacterium]|nr:hypothetical protein [Planctomycetota bacterium]
MRNSPLRLLSFADGYTLLGCPEALESHVGHFREKGKIRAKSLVPSDDPFGELYGLAKSPRWIFRNSERVYDARDGDFMLLQALGFIETVSRVEPDQFGRVLPYVEKWASRRDEILAEASPLNIRWDANAQKYTLLDGSSLPDPDPNRYPRDLWRPDAAGLDVDLIQEREGPHHASVWTDERVHSGKSPSAATIRVFRPGAKGETLAKFAVGGENPDMSNGWKHIGDRINIDEGVELQAEVTVEGATRESPVFIP